MTAVSLINPYAPQPAAHTPGDVALAAGQQVTALSKSGADNDMGSASDQSGHGAGNGTGTGGAQVAALLTKGRQEMATPQPTPRSIVEAQSEADVATQFLERQERQRIEAKAAEHARISDQAAARATQAKAEAAKAAQPEYVMPNPLPTAPILERDKT